MRLYYDLHIHSSLSPCGEEDMTPNNIVNMALLKGLDVIAVTDHNCALNLPAIEKVAQDAGILLIPGIEVSTSEEIHVLTYFEDVKTAVEFGEYLYENLPDINNRPDIFGNQYVLDAQDNVIKDMPKLLINATRLSIDKVVRQAREAGGYVLPAHVNKQSNSILANLGFIPEDLGCNSVEVAPNLPLSGVDVTKYRLITSSDAHTLWDISEKENYINVEQPTRRCILEKITN